MTNATLRGKPDAGNPHVRFDEGEVASTKPRRGSLLYNVRNVLIVVLALCLQVVSAEARECVFFVGAHPDDTEGYAATAFLLRQTYDVHVIDLTRGELGLGLPGLKDGSTAKRRMAEEADACACLGATPHFLDEIDGFAYAGKPSVDRLAGLLRTFKPVAVFTHWPVDMHPDHVQTAAVTRRAVAEAEWQGEYYFYEVLRCQTKNFRPLYSVDVTETIGKKAEMLRKYVCQNPNDSLVAEKVEQARVRGGERRPVCAAAELFTTYDGSRFVNGVLERLRETAVVEETCVARPVPRPALLKRLTDGPDLIGIVHWGLNTYTDRDWGLGDEDPALLDPSDFDADQIVVTAKAGGLQGLVVVAKHHDGFCLWPTKTTEHNITRSPFRGGKGDYVREMSEACRRHGLRFGVYCSPWDRNNAEYGRAKYVETYHAQLRELLDGRYGEVFEMWFDNANGGDGYYGGAREKRKIPTGYYRFEEVFRFVRELQPSVCIFNEDDGADLRWPGNEKGIIGDSCRATGGHFDIDKYEDYMTWTNAGVTNGVTFHPPEADFPLRPEWFYHASEDGKTKSAAYLMQRYLNVVGNGGVMNVGLAPDKTGRMCAEDVRALSEFGALLRTFFATPVTEGLCNVVVMREDISAGELVDEWRLVIAGRHAEPIASGTAIGSKRIRLLDGLYPTARLCLQATGGSGMPPKIRPLSFYRVDEDLIKRIVSAIPTSGETSTAEKMNAARTE